ncbi:MAG: hypothetical protein GC199_10300 [Alphaproteobacteria bacterium]|nr:hypothetical protein [Alphaproteobacteria bacterium]
MVELPITIGDVIIALVVIVSAAHATSHGLTAETLRVAAWIVAAVATARFFPVFRPVAEANLQPAWLATTVGVLALFLIVLIPLSFITYRISSSVVTGRVSSLDRSLGFFFGVARGLVVLAVALIGLTMLVPRDQHPVWLREARLLPLVQATGNVLLSVVPEKDRPLSETSLAGTRGSGSSERPSRPEETPRYNERDRDALDALIDRSN